MRVVDGWCRGSMTGRSIERARHNWLCACRRGRPGCPTCGGMEAGHPGGSTRRPGSHEPPTGGWRVMVVAQRSFCRSRRSSPSRAQVDAAVVVLFLCGPLIGLSFPAALFGAQGVEGGDVLFGHPSFVTGSYTVTSTDFSVAFLGARSVPRVSLVRVTVRNETRQRAVT